MGTYLSTKASFCPGAVSPAASLPLILLLLEADKHLTEGRQVSAVPWVLGISARVASEWLCWGLCHGCLSPTKWLGAKN